VIGVWTAIGLASESFVHVLPSHAQVSLKVLSTSAQHVFTPPKKTTRLFRGSHAMCEPRKKNLGGGEAAGDTLVHEAVSPRQVSDDVPPSKFSFPPNMNQPPRCGSMAIAALYALEPLRRVGRGPRS
jgi:hypothetical protein